MSIILPGARLGVSRPIGCLPTPQGRPGIEVLVIDYKVVVHIWRHAPNARGRIVSEKFYAVELPAASAAQLAELLHQGAVHAFRAGGSPMNAQAKPTVLQPTASR